MRSRFLLKVSLLSLVRLIRYVLLQNYHVLVKEALISVRIWTSKSVSSSQDALGSSDPVDAYTLYYIDPSGRKHCCCSYSWAKAAVATSDTSSVPDSADRMSRLTYAPLLSPSNFCRRLLALPRQG